MKKQLKFHDATTGFSVKKLLRNVCRNSILLMYHHPDLDRNASVVFNL